MSQTHAKNYVHIIFSTKDRFPFLNPEILPGLHKYMSAILYNWDTPVLEINSVKDHIHICAVLSKNHSAAKVMQELKSNSSKWVKEHGGLSTKFAWQGGYGMFSLCPSILAKTKQYIRNQVQHHKKKTFQEEYLEFLKMYEVEFDEKYIWD